MPRHPTVLEAVLDAIDPCASLYNFAQRQDAVDVLRCKLLAFVTGPAHAYFGPKRSRLLAMWLSGNRSSSKTDLTDIIKRFVAFILDADPGWRIEYIERNGRGLWVVIGSGPGPEPHS